MSLVLAVLAQRHLFAGDDMNVAQSGALERFSAASTGTIVALAASRQPKGEVPCGYQAPPFWFVPWPRWSYPPRLTPNFVTPPHINIRPTGTGLRKRTCG